MKLFIFLLSIGIFSSLLLEENFKSVTSDAIKCNSYEDTTKCKEIMFETKSFQCCNQRKKSVRGDKTSESEECFPIINPVKPAQDETITTNGQIMIKEYFGFNKFMNEEKSTDISDEYYYTCQDGSFNFKVDFADYTNEEIKKYNDINHCFNFDRDEPYKPADKETCFNSILATAEKDSGVSCGFFEYQINLNDSTTRNYSLCFLFDEEIIENKNIGFMMKQLLTIIANKVAVSEEKELSDYKITGTNYKGSSFTYYFSNDNFIVDGEPNYYKFLEYKYLFLIFLFLI